LTPEDDFVITIVEDRVKHWLQIMLPQNLLLLPSEMFEDFKASLSVTFLDFLNKQHVQVLDLLEFRSPPVLLHCVFTNIECLQLLIILGLGIIDLRHLHGLQLLPGGGLFQPLFATLLLGLPAVLDKAEEGERHEEERSEDEVVPEEAAAEHNEGVDGLLPLQFVVQEATDGREEREGKEEDREGGHQGKVGCVQGLGVQQVCGPWVVEVF
jgi:hypothetical protein